MTDHAIEELDRRGLRNFGLTFGAVIVVLFGLFFPWVLGLSFPSWPWLVWLFLAVWSFTAPMTLRPFYRGWMKFGLLISKITTPLVMGTVYYAAIVPTGLIASLFRRDPLHRDCEQGVETFRIESSERSREHMENPF
jgi:O-antigen/teichoic acid export membrane protein